MGDTASEDEPDPGESNGGSNGGTSRWGAGRLWFLPVLAAAAVVSGVVVILTSAPLGGWFGVPPLSTDFGFVVGKTVILSNQELAGWAVLVLGFGLLLFWLGFRLGQRGPRHN